MAVPLDPPDVLFAHTDKTIGCEQVPQQWRMTGGGRFYLSCPGCGVLALDPERRETDYRRPPDGT